MGVVECFNSLSLPESTSLIRITFIVAHYDFFGFGKK